MPRPPFMIGDFVGQKEALTPLLREQDGARSRGEPLPPTLFTGPSGTGKSLAARTLAQRAGTNIIRLSATNTPLQIGQELITLRSCDVVFCDECHRLPDDAQELFFELIDRGTIPNEPTTPNCEPVKIAPLTLIFATDRPGRLLDALYKRIPITVRFRSYSTVELKEIVARVAKRRNMLLSPQAARQLAITCSGLPRRAEHYVTRLRLFFSDSERRQLGRRDVHEFLLANGIDSNGLGKDERRYLTFLGRNRAASLEALSGYLGVDPDYVRKQIEQSLRHRNFITVRSSGRVLTRAGKEWVGQLRKSRKTNRGE
jgi:holliday junction DNA helicase RuvB